MIKVLMTEPELLTIFESIIKNEELHAGEQMDLILKLLKITNWLKHNE